jgi:hypothetical protein
MSAAFGNETSCRRSDSPSVISLKIKVRDPKIAHLLLPHAQTAEPEASDLVPSGPSTIFSSDWPIGRQSGIIDRSGW